MRLLSESSSSPSSPPADKNASGSPPTGNVHHVGALEAVSKGTGMDGSSISKSNRNVDQNNLDTTSSSSSCAWSESNLLFLPTTTTTTVSSTLGSGTSSSTPGVIRDTCVRSANVGSAGGLLLQGVQTGQSEADIVVYVAKEEGARAPHPQSNPQQQQQHHHHLHHEYCAAQGDGSAITSMLLSSSSKNHINSNNKSNVVVPQSLPSSLSQEQVSASSSFPASSPPSSFSSPSASACLQATSGANTFSNTCVVNVVGNSGSSSHGSGTGKSQSEYFAVNCRATPGLISSDLSASTLSSNSQQHHHDGEEQKPATDSSLLLANQLNASNNISRSGSLLVDVGLSGGRRQLQQQQQQCNPNHVKELMRGGGGPTLSPNIIVPTTSNASTTTTTTTTPYSAVLSLPFEASTTGATPQFYGLPTPSSTSSNTSALSGHIPIPRTLSQASANTQPNVLNNNNTTISSNHSKHPIITHGNGILDVLAQAGEDSPSSHNHVSSPVCIRIDGSQNPPGSNNIISNISSSHTPLANDQLSDNTRMTSHQSPPHHHPPHPPFTPTVVSTHVSKQMIQEAKIIGKENLHEVLTSHHQRSGSNNLNAEQGSKTPVKSLLQTGINNLVLLPVPSPTEQGSVAQPQQPVGTTFLMDTHNGESTGVISNNTLKFSVLGTTGNLTPLNSQGGGVHAQESGNNSPSRNNGMSPPYPPTSSGYNRGFLVSSDAQTDTHDLQVTTAASSGPGNVTTTDVYLAPPPPPPSRTNRELRKRERRERRKDRGHIQGQLPPTPSSGNPAPSNDSCSSNNYNNNSSRDHTFANNMNNNVNSNHSNHRPPSHHHPPLSRVSSRVATNTSHQGTNSNNNNSGNSNSEMGGHTDAQATRPMQVLPSSNSNISNHNINGMSQQQPTNNGGGGEDPQNPPPLPPQNGSDLLNSLSLPPYSTLPNGDRRLAGGPPLPPMAHLQLPIVSMPMVSGVGPHPGHMQIPVQLPLAPPPPPPILVSSPASCLSSATQPAVRYHFSPNIRASRRSLRLPRGVSYASEDEPKSCCGMSTTQAVSIRWFIIVIAVIGISCTVAGTALGAAYSNGREHLTLSLLMIGVGVVLLTVSGVAWRLTAHESGTSCRAMLGFARSAAVRGDGGTEPNRRFVPRLAPTYGRPHHPYAAMMYPEFQYRPPPPSYQASMQEYRLRLLLLERSNPTIAAAAALASPSSLSMVPPPPAYRPYSGTLRNGGHTRNDPDYSRPPSYRSRSSGNNGHGECNMGNRPSMDPSAGHHLHHVMLESPLHSRDPSLLSYLSQQSIADNVSVVSGHALGTTAGGGTAVVTVMQAVSVGMDLGLDMDMFPGNHPNQDLNGKTEVHLAEEKSGKDESGCIISSSNNKDCVKRSKDGNLVRIVQTTDSSQVIRRDSVIVTVSGSNHTLWDQSLHHSPATGNNQQTNHHLNCHHNNQVFGIPTSQSGGGPQTGNSSQSNITSSSCSQVQILAHL